MYLDLLYVAPNLTKLAALRAKLDRTFEFDFVDGPFECTSAPGVDKLFDGGSGAYAWWPADTPRAIRSSHAWLDDYLAAHGPYDALMGFSQGCLLISSYLMHRARDLGASSSADTNPLPFRSAIFLCGGLSFTSLDTLGVVVPPEALEIERQSVVALHAKTRLFRELASQPDQIQRGVRLWDDTSTLIHTLGEPLPPVDDVFGMNLSSAGGFPQDLFITIPTVHVYGSRDPRYPAAIQLAYTSRTRSMYDHEGGHEIPRTTEVSERIAGLIKQLARDIGA